MHWHRCWSFRVEEHDVGCIPCNTVQRVSHNCVHIAEVVAASVLFQSMVVHGAQVYVSPQLSATPRRKCKPDIALEPTHSHWQREQDARARPIQRWRYRIKPPISSYKGNTLPAWPNPARQRADYAGRQEQSHMRLIIKHSTTRYLHTQTLAQGE